MVLLQIQKIGKAVIILNIERKKHRLRDVTFLEVEGVL